MKQHVFSIVALLIFVASGCASIGDPERARGIAAAALPEAPVAWAAAQQGESVEVGWIAKLGDPVLNRLVVEALENNRNLQAAAASIDEARASAAQAGAPLLPSVDITASGARAGNIELPSAPSYGVGAQLNWEIDVWGRVRAGRNAAAMGLYSQEADFLFTQYSIAAAVAQTYFQLIEAGLQLGVSRQSLAALGRTQEIVSAQRDIGAASGLDLALAQTDLANAKDAVIDGEGARRGAMRALEVLLGRYPAGIIDSANALPSLPARPGADTPSSLLERRPDLIAAELSVAAAFNNVQAARAARLPTFSLASSINGASPELADVLDPENVAWQVAGNLLGPLFDNGLRKSRVDEASAKESQAIAAYAQAAITAFQEVENSLDQNAVLANREAALKEAAANASAALDLAQIRYREGETNLLDVLQIQSSKFAADSALVRVQSQQLQEWVTLNLALGGGW